MNVEIQSRLADIAARWNEVERRMKQVELLRREAIIPAINELRYTGRKIADALLLVSRGEIDCETSEKIKQELVIAENYLINADHDVTDFAILFVSLQVRHIFELHGKAKVVRCIPDFESYSDVLKDAEIIVVESRGDRQNRKEIYKRLAAEHIPKLIDLYGKLSAHAELSLPNSPIKRGVRLATIYAFIGSVAGVFTFLLNLWIWHTSPPRLSLDQVRHAVSDAVRDSRAAN